MFASVEQAIAALQQGKMILIVDDEARENEGDILIAADFITPEAINFLATEARTVIVVPCGPEVIKQMQLKPMATQNQNQYHTAFTVSIEAAAGVTTGISATDRVTTIKALANPHAIPEDIVSPGHIFPLAAKSGGVLERPGHTEASVDLLKLAGLTPVGVMCELANIDGSMARLSDCQAFADKHKILLLKIEDLINYRLKLEQHITLSASAQLPMNNFGEFQVDVLDYAYDNLQYVVIHKPNLTDKPMLMRVHSECFTGDILGSLRCDCGEQLDYALEKISEEGGMLIYLRQEGRGIGLANKLKAYAMQDQGLDTVQANEQLGLPIDARNYGVCAQICKYYGLDNIRLLTNNPEKISGLQMHGITVSERVAVQTEPNAINKTYLKTKRDKLGHMISNLQESA